MSFKNNLIQKAKSKLCFKPHKLCGIANFSMNDTTFNESSYVRVVNHKTQNETIDSFKTTIIDSNMDNERELSQANETVNISRFPLLVCSPEQTRTKRENLVDVNKSPISIDQSNESIREGFTQMWVESFGFNSNDFNSVNSEFFNQSIQIDLPIKPEILSQAPVFV